jgi:hypothetical protein
MTAVLLVLAAGLLGSGCSTLQESAASQATTSPTPEPFPSTSTSTTVPTAAVTPHPFPDAMPLSEIFRYGDNTTARELTIYRYRIQSSYDYYSEDWGKYWTSEAPAGQQYLIVFVRVAHRGTAESGAPYPSYIRVQAAGTSYYPMSDRDEDVPLKNINELQYYGGLIYPTHVREGFLIYTIPAGTDPRDIFVQCYLGNNATPTWRLV